MMRERCLVAFTLFAIASDSGLIHGQEDLSSITLDDVARAWRTRHEEIRSGRFEWEETKWIRQGSLSAYDTMRASDGPIPAEDLTLVYESSFQFDGERIRLEQEGPRWNHNEGEFLETQHIGVWDGEEGEVLRQEMGFDHGEIYDFAWDLTQRPLLPFRLSIRMLHPQWYNLDLSRFVIADRIDVVNGFRCIRMETSPQALAEQQSRGQDPWKYTYWISPQQNFFIVRFTRSKSGLPRASEEMSIVYSENPEHGWYPSAWRLVDGSGDVPNEIIEGTVGEYALNVPIPGERFDYEFPEGTWVRDTRINHSYIVRAAGDDRPVTEAELFRGATYEDLVRTDTGEAGLVRRRRAWETWGAWFIAGAVILVSCGYCLWRRI